MKFRNIARKLRKFTRERLKMNKYSKIKIDKVIGWKIDRNTTISVFYHHSWAFLFFCLGKFINNHFLSI
jgi:hypothetical protein